MEHTFKTELNANEQKYLESFKDTGPPRGLDGLHRYWELMYKDACHQLHERGDRIAENLRKDLDHETKMTEEALTSKNEEILEAWSETDRLQGEIDRLTAQVDHYMILVEFMCEKQMTETKGSS